MKAILFKTMYCCDHCQKLYQSKSNATRHENRCRKNPLNIRACHDCEHLAMVKTEYYFDSYCGEHESIVNVLFCKALDTYIYPPKVEWSTKGPYEFGDKENKPMPMECDSQKTYLSDLMINNDLIKEL